MRLKLQRKPIGYYVYRADDESLPFPKWERITPEPILEGNFSDPASEHGKRFFYKLTQVFSNGEESLPIDANTTFVDHGGNEFAENPLRGFAGYNIYRSADETTPLEEWERRNINPVPDESFKDEGVESGEVYFYFVRAVDSDGNESAPGEIFRVVRQCALS